MPDIEFPIEVTGIEFKSKPIVNSMHPTGTWVSVRPCNEEYENKTFLGVLLGDLPVSTFVVHRKDQVLELFHSHNPAVYVPELKKIIFGCESWWGVIKSPEHLRKITDEDIDNVWYVQALKQLAKEDVNGQGEDQEERAAGDSHEEQG
jgi:hypothetical protein